MLRSRIFGLWLRAESCVRRVKLLKAKEFPKRFCLEGIWSGPPGVHREVCNMYYKLTTDCPLMVTLQFEYLSFDEWAGWAAMSGGFGSQTRGGVGCRPRRGNPKSWIAAFDPVLSDKYGLWLRSSMPAAELAIRAFLDVRPGRFQADLPHAACCSALAQVAR